MRRFFVCQCRSVAQASRLLSAANETLALRAVNLLFSQRSERAEHSSRLLGWAAFNFAVLFQLRNDVLHHFAALFDMSHLATTELNGDLHLIIVFKKANRLLDFEINIVLARLGTHTDLFQFCLMLLTFGSTLALVVLKFTVVHNTTDRRLGLRGHFDEVESQILRFGQCVSRSDDTQLSPFVVNDTNGRDANTFVDSILW